MRKLFFLMLCIMTFAAILNAKTIYVKSDGSGTADGLTWANAVTLARAGTLATTSGDLVYVKGGTYNFTKTAPSAAGAFGTAAGVSYYGSFSGTETAPTERATSDVDGNGIIEPWEFSNQTILNFTLTNSSAGFTTSNASGIVTNINGFKFTGTNIASDFSSAANVRVTMRISKNIHFENNMVADWTVTGAFSTSTTLSAPFFEVYTASGYGNILINNCLFANNTITYTSTQSTDAVFHPFIYLASAQGITRNLMSNSVVRNNRVTLDYSGSTVPSSNNQRGLLVSIQSPTAGYPTTLKNTIIHNNEVTFTPKSGILACYGAPVYVYNAATTVSDSIINNTIANNKTTNCSSAGIKIGMDLNDPHEKPNHFVLNNVMYNNKNNGSVSNFEANFEIPSTSAAMVKNNISNGGVILITNNSVNVADNLFDLSDENVGTNGAFFNRPTTEIGYVADGTVELSRWVIASNSYLKGKGITTLNTKDKSGLDFALTPSVGAYEYDATFYTRIINNTMNNNLISIEGRNIKSSIQGSMEVYNSVGRLVATSGKSESTITLNNGGIYIVKINTANVNKVQKIIIQ
ncbi:MAG: T9SS type A sorting domain-containing protein [Haliscomenobacter sp.]|nr:T9SS type A sorting domain-containing protein [Haliscomenobacter sp.]